MKEEGVHLRGKMSKRFQRKAEDTHSSSESRAFVIENKLRDGTLKKKLTDNA